MVTLISVLATDLLIGVGIGILLKFAIHASNGVPIRSMFKPFLEIQPIDDHTSIIVAKESAVFSNWIPFRRQIEEVGLVQRRNLIVDVSGAMLVDHSVVEKLDEMQQDFAQEGLTFEVRGLDSLKPLADSPHAARKRSLIPMRRLTVTASADSELDLVERFSNLGASSYTMLPVLVSGPSSMLKEEKVRLEFIIPFKVCDRILDVVRADMQTDHLLTVCVETVNVIRTSDFIPEPGPMTY